MMAFPPPLPRPYSLRLRHPAPRHAPGQEYVVTFDSVRPIYEYNRTWDFNAYKTQQHSVKTLREQMQRIGVWVNELEKMRARQPCGILEVGARRPA